MRKLLLTTAILTLWGSVNVMAQTAQDTVYVFKEDQPKGHKFIPAPPDSLSTDFIDDMTQWQWGKKQRETPRGEQADRESLWRPEIMRTVMAEVLELDTISDEATPALSRLLVKTYNTGDQSAGVAKDSVTRTRPFLMMNEDLWARYDTEFLRTNSSFPSGHSAFGWATALVFAEMWPELQDTILRRGFLFGENRVITGAHWQSDVYAGYLCGAASVARAHTNPELEKDILAARAEYARLKGLPADYDPVSKADVPYGERFLNNPVDTTSYRYLADVMRYWKARELRETDRGKRAAVEAEYSVNMMSQIYGEALGITISPETTPSICSLLEVVLTRASDIADRLKPIRFRKRPFVQLGEPSSVPGDEEKERGKSSFPSGHTNLGWSTALVMAEVAPECQDEVLRRGYDYGYNRLIVGYHWASDIEASRPLASALIARLHADASFRQLIAAARAEYVQATTGVAPATVAAPSFSAKAYRVDGTPATDNTRGIVIKNGQKVVVR